jgi:hypothetical protein
MCFCCEWENFVFHQHMLALVVAILVGASTEPSCSALKAQLPATPTIAALEVTAPDLDLEEARRIFERFGVLIVRSLHSTHVPHMLKASESAYAQAVELLNAGHTSVVKNDDHVVGWVTPDQTLFTPAPEGHERAKQTMILGLDYFSDATMLSAATDARALDVVQAITGWPAIELFGKGQCFFKEGIPTATTHGGVDSVMMGANASVDTGMDMGVQPGGSPKYLHQDSAYFMFAHDGAVASLTYAVNVSGELDNGPLFVVPGSHRLGHLPHVDTPSHLGVPSHEWTFADALRIDGTAGDTIFFHIHALHGSTPNRSPMPRPTFINRYLEPSDYQLYFATDARMRERAEADYLEHVREGQLPPKERGIMVRGRRKWEESGPAWQLNEKVNH